MEPQVVFVVQGERVVVPRVLLKYFKSLDTMVSDSGGSGGEIPLFSEFGRITPEGLRWLVKFYRDYDEADAPDNIVAYTLQRPAIMEPLAQMPLKTVLEIFNFAHFVDSTVVEAALLTVLTQRLYDLSDPLELSGPLIAIEDMQFPEEQAEMLTTVVTSMPYGRRYREILTLLRESGTDLSIELLRQLKKLLSPPSLGCGRYFSVILTGIALYAYGSNAYFQLGVEEGANELSNNFVTPVEEFKFPPLVGPPNPIVPLSVSCGERHTMLLTSDGLYACGANDRGQLGLGRQTRKTMRLPFRLVGSMDDEKIVKVVCGELSTSVITETSLFITNFFKNEFVMQEGYTGTPIDTAGGMLVTSDGLFYSENDPHMSAGDATKFSKVPIAGRPRAVAYSKEYGYLVTTSTDVFQWIPDKGEVNFEKLAVEGSPISVSCGSNYFMVITSEGLFAFGNNEHGQLGVRPGAQKKTTMTKIPVIGKPMHVACGTSHCILLTSKGFYGTGDNDKKQLGEGLPSRVVGFMPILLPGTQERPPKEEVQPTKKPRRARRDPLKACRVCDASPALMHQEIVHTDRLFCSPLCQRKYHYFAQVLSAVHQ